MSVNGCDELMNTSDKSSDNSGVDDEDSTSANETDSSSCKSDKETNVLLHCELCNTNMYAFSGYNWMRCTICTDLHICTDCWAKGGHKEHNDQIHAYTWHSEQNNKPGLSCDSCGFLYHCNNYNFMIWRCRDCGDYSICKRCYERKMHQHHLEYLDNIFLSEYGQELI